MDRDELVRACQGLVRSLAWQEHQRIGRRIELDDLIQYGQMGLLRAADRFDPERGNACTTYAYTCIHGAILDGLRELKWFNIRDYAGGRYQRISRQVLDDDGGSDAAAAEMRGPPPLPPNDSGIPSRSHSGGKCLPVGKYGRCDRRSFQFCIPCLVASIAHAPSPAPSSTHRTPRR